jgi:hypothetical protein
VAALLKQELGIEACLQRGSTGEFRVVVGEDVVAKKRWFRFPTDQTVLAAVKRALSG